MMGTMATSTARPRLLSPALPMMSTIKIAARLGLAKHALRAIATRSFFPQKFVGEFRGYEPDEHDVFVATFAKSGTNWAMQIAHQIAHHGQAEYAHIHDVIPWPEAPMPDIVKLSDPQPRRAAPTGLRVIKTHVAAD